MTPYIEKETSSPKIGRVYLQKELKGIQDKNSVAKFLID